MLAWQTDRCEPITQRFQEQRLTAQDISARHSVKQLVHISNILFTLTLSIFVAVKTRQFLVLS